MAYGREIGSFMVVEAETLDEFCIQYRFPYTTKINYFSAWFVSMDTSINTSALVFRATVHPSSIR